VLKIENYLWAFCKKKKKACVPSLHAMRWCYFTHKK